MPIFEKSTSDKTLTPTVEDQIDSFVTDVSITMIMVTKRHWILLTVYAKISNTKKNLKISYLKIQKMA